MKHRAALTWCASSSVTTYTTRNVEPDRHNENMLTSTIRLKHTCSQAQAQRKSHATALQHRTVPRAAWPLKKLLEVNASSGIKWCREVGPAGRRTGNRQTARALHRRRVMPVVRRRLQRPWRIAIVTGCTYCEWVPTEVWRAGRRARRGYVVALSPSAGDVVPRCSSHCLQYLGFQSTLA
jgi:hypothetical protein